MNKGIVHVSLILLSLAVAGSAYAGPGRMRMERQAFQRQAVREQRAGREEERQQPVESGRPGQNPNGAPMQNQGPGRQGPGEMGQSGNVNPGQNQAQSQFPRAGARMSAEERQKLRRQINEAGRSIYVPPTK